MDTTVAARALMADSLGFHIFFALLGVGLPLTVSMIEFWAIRKKDNNLREAARKLSLVSLVLVVAGVVSGTIIGIQMSLMWSGLVAFGGSILGLAFMLEGYAFLLEAIFLAFYVATWKKLKGYKHFLLGIPVIIGAFMSAFFITSANAWMQNPSGFDFVDGKITNPRIWEGLLTRTTFFMTSHSIMGYYATTFLLVIGGYAWYLLRGKPVGVERDTVRLIMKRLSIATVCAIFIIAGLGHLSLQYLAKNEPRKFAAIELVPHATTRAPYVIGGHLSEDGQTVEGGIRIPNGLSLLTGGSANTQVPGLNDFPREAWPLLIINKLFEIKMLLVGLMAAIPLGFLALYFKWREKAFSKPVLVALLLAGPVAVVVIELGWMIAEFGRQPYAVAGYLLTKDAFSHNPGVLQWGYIFPSLFVVLFVATGLALRSTVRHFNPRPKKTEVTS